MDVGSGGGTVNLDGVTLPSYPYSMDISSGTSVTVQAVPDFFHVFDSWSGDLRTEADTAILVVDCNKRISATFSLNWRFIGSTGGSLALIILLGTVLIIRKNVS